MRSVALLLTVILSCVATNAQQADNTAPTGTDWLLQETANLQLTDETLQDLQMLYDLPDLPESAAEVEDITPTEPVDDTALQDAEWEALLGDMWQAASLHEINLTTRLGYHSNFLYLPGEAEGSAYWELAAGYFGSIMPMQWSHLGQLTLMIDGSWRLYTSHTIPDREFDEYYWTGSLIWTLPSQGPVTWRIYHTSLGYKLPQAIRVLSEDLFLASQGRSHIFSLDRSLAVNETLEWRASGEYSVLRVPDGTFDTDEYEIANELTWQGQHYELSANVYFRYKRYDTLNARTRLGEPIDDERLEYLYWGSDWELETPLPGGLPLTQKSQLGYEYRQDQSEGYANYHRIKGSVRIDYTAETWSSGVTAYLSHTAYEHQQVSDTAPESLLQTVVRYTWDVTIELSPFVTLEMDITRERIFSRRFDDRTDYTEVRGSLNYRW